jgi:hypothetical protein
MPDPSEKYSCPDCGAALSAPDALCPACLLQRGLEPNTVPPTIASAAS